MKIHISVLGLTVLLVGGCSSAIHTTQLKDNKSLKEGIIYYMPQTELHYHVNYKLKDCTKSNVIIDTTLSKLDFVSVRDASSTYVLDYAKLASATKSTDFTIELYETGTLKSVNVEANDLTGEIISGLAGVAGKLATVNIPGQFRDPSKSNVLPAYLELCDADIKRNINKDSRLSKALAAKKSILDNAIKDLKAYREKTGATEAIIKTKLEALDTAISEYRQADDEYSTNLKKISFSEVYKRLDTHKDNIGQDGFSYTLTPPVKPIGAWINKAATDRNVLISKIAQENTINVTINPRDKYLMDQESIGIENIKGIVYRIPVNVRVNVALFNGKTLYDKHHDLSGLGYLAVVPFKNDTFEENSVSVTFRENGMIEKLTYKTNSPAKRIVSSLDDVADQMVEYKEAKRKKPLTDLQDQVAYYELLKKYNELTKEPHAELAQLELDIKLQELAAKMDQLSIDEVKRELERIKIEQDIKALSGPSI